MAHNKRESDYFRQYCITKKSECKRKNLPFDLDPEYLEEIWTKELKQIVSWMERVTTIPKGSTPKQVEAVDTEDSVKR